MTISLNETLIRNIDQSLRASNSAFMNIYPGETGRRQPVHTVYGGAHLFRFDSAQRLGQVAERALVENAPDFVVFARALGLPRCGELPDVLDYATGLRHRLETNAEAVREENPAAWLAHTIYTRVQEKLKREPVEDFRIDFEDGYGNRPDAEEDGHAASAATEVVNGMNAGTLPPFIGIRIKPFNEELRARSMRTLDIFVSTLLDKMGGRLPDNFVVTLPKITTPEQVAALADLFDLLEKQSALPSGALKMEMMIETTQSIINSEGRINLPLLLQAARGRCLAAHFGTYDYTASCSITAAHQHMMHPACDFAKHMMQVKIRSTKTAQWSVARGNCITITSNIRSSMVSIKVGICIRRNCPRAMLRFTLSFWKVSTRRQNDCATLSRRPPRRPWWEVCLTMPPPARACSIISCARSTAAP